MSNDTGDKPKKKRKPRPANPRRARFGRIATLIGYFGLLGLILNWFIWIAPPVSMPRAFPLLLLAVPLLFPLRGILHARRYTHQWTSFLAMPYFMLGIDAWFNAAEGSAWLGALTVAFATLLFIGTCFFAGYTPSDGPSRAALEEIDSEARAAAAHAQRSGED